MFSVAILAAAAFAQTYHVNIIAAEPITFVDPKDTQALKALGVSTDNYGIDYKLINPTTVDCTIEDSDGGFNFALTDNQGNFCGLIFSTDPIRETATVLTDKEPSKGLKCTVETDDQLNINITVV
ncbi:hypothetical protein HDV01_007543 [Terramyces sp. JEL0728]|nr:hypothetical protein HDV01_007543 [Terramyces sp. JEL0728]